MKHKNRDIFLSTFSMDALKVIKKYDIGIEFNQFCVSKTLDAQIINWTLAAMERDAEDCGIALPEDRRVEPEYSSRKETNYPRGKLIFGPEDIEGPVLEYEGYGEPEVDEILEDLKKRGGEGEPLGNVVDPVRALVHGPFTEFIPAAIDPAALGFMMGRANRAARGTMALGLKRMVLHTGYYPEVYFAQWHVKQSIRFWEKFMSDKPEDFRLYIENVFDPEPDTLKEIVETLDDPRIMACVDVGHAAAVGTDPLDWIKALGPKIGHFHLHNNDGTADMHRPLTEGVIDMEQVLCAIDDYCPEDATLTIESRECDESVSWLKSRLGQE